MGTLPQSKNIHFEVLGLKNTSWAILKIEQVEEKALKLAEDKWATGAFKAIKVVRERLNPEDGSYRSSELYLKGKEPKQNEKKGGAKTCWKPSDLGSYEGRRTINKLLLSDLEKWQITAIELVNVPDHYYRLDDTGVVLQNAVQKAAIEQVKGSEVSIQDRMKELYSLIELAVAQLKEFYKDDKKIPNLTDLGLDEVITRLEKQDDRAYILNLSIIQSFLAIPTIPEKFSSILDKVKQDHPSWAHTVVDSIVSELIASPSVVRKLLQDLGGIGPTLVSFAQLSCGTLPADNPSSELKSLNNLVKLDRLRQTKLALYGRIANELKGRQDLSNEGTLGELKVVNAIIKTLRGPDNASIGDFRLIDAIDERCGRCLSQQNIGDFLAPIREPSDQIEALLDLEQYIQGESAQKKLAGYLMPIITAGENENTFKSIEGNYLVRLKTLNRIQRRVLASRLPEGNKNKLAEKLDDYCLMIVDGAQILPRLRKDAGGPVAAGQKLLQMIANGYFTVGNASSKVRAEARAYMRLPNFIEKCITGDTDGERAKSLLALQALLTKSGMAGNKD